MVADAELPAGWTIWHEEPEGRMILTYRSDVFDADAFPAACLPTIFVSNAPHRHRRPEQRTEGYSSDWWFVTLFLEPDVVLEESRFDTRDAAVQGALCLARQFAAGELDYRGAYQEPREEYLDRLDELIPRDA